MSAKELVHNFFANMEAGDVEGTLALVAPGTHIKLVPLNREGTAEETGREYLTQLKSAFPDLQVRVRRAFVGKDGTGVAEVVIQGTQSDDFFGIINQEKLMDLEQVWLLHMSNGSIDNITAYWCQNKLYRRLGVKRLDRITITA
jgi:ketosteroid isomerase-like protein